MDAHATVASASASLTRLPVSLASGRMRSSFSRRTFEIAGDEIQAVPWCQDPGWGGPARPPRPPPVQPLGRGIVTEGERLTVVRRARPALRRRRAGTRGPCPIALPQEMMSEHAEMLRQAVGVKLLHGFPDPGMLRTPLLLSPASLRHFMSQRVLEGVDQLRPHCERGADQFGCPGASGDARPRRAAYRARRARAARRGNSRPKTAATRMTSRDVGIEPLRGGRGARREMLSGNIDSGLLDDTSATSSFASFERARAPATIGGFLRRRTDCLRSFVVDELLQLVGKALPPPASEEAYRAAASVALTLLASVNWVPNPRPCANGTVRIRSGESRRRRIRPDAKLSTIIPRNSPVA